MTTVANKHGLRKAANDRRNRHAQRTPLPPRPGQVEEAREAIAEAKEATATGGKSQSKAEAFRAEVEKHGWSATVAPSQSGEPDHIEVEAKRGNEFIHIEWVGGVYQPGATYTIADRTIRLRNASACKQYAARSPEVAEEELSRVVNNKSFRRKPTPEGEIKRQRLPFDPELATDLEIIEAVRGRAIRWHNRYRETQETAMVGSPGNAGRGQRGIRHVHITTYDGQRILNFLCPATGFRSCLVTAITAVGKGHGPTKGQNTAEVTIEEEL